MYIYWQFTRIRTHAYKQTNTSVHRKITAIVIIIDQIDVIIDFDGMSLSMHTYIRIHLRATQFWADWMKQTQRNEQNGEHNRNISISIPYFRFSSSPALSPAVSLSLCCCDLISGFAWLAIFFISPLSTLCLFFTSIYFKSKKHWTLLTYGRILDRN